MSIYHDLTFYSTQELEDHLQCADKLYCMRLFLLHPKLRRLYDLCKKHSLKQIDLEECFFSSIQLLFPESIKMKYRHHKYGLMHLITIPIPEGLVLEEKTLMKLIGKFEGVWNPYMTEALSLHIEGSDIRVLVEESHLTCFELLLGFMKLEWLFENHCKQAAKKKESEAKTNEFAKCG